MDGINPTLAFAVLFFGISGSPRDEAIDTKSNIDGNDWSSCPALVFAHDISLYSAESGEVSAPRLPEVMDPGWSDAAFPVAGIAEPVDNDPDLSFGPIARRIVPAGTAISKTDRMSEPCGPKR